MKNINDIIKERILVLDGAMGTMVQAYGLNEADFRGERFKDHPIQLMGNNDVLSLTRPDIIADIHSRYLAVGADIITTNTFSSQRISQADYALESLSKQMAFLGAKIARQEADRFSTPDKPRFVVGSIGPTNKTASMSPDVNNPALRDICYDDLFDAYKEQVEGLIDGGVDGFLIETIFDTLNCKAAIAAVQKVMDTRNITLPIMLSVTVSDNSGRTLSGQTLEAFLSTISSFDIFSVGLNCSFGAAQMKPFLRRLAERAPYYISAHPNAGLPNELGAYNETAESMSPQIAEFIDEGLVNIIGGCCGTDESFIERYSQLVVGKQPHVIHPRYRQLHLAGIDSLVVSPEVKLVNVGERCNVAGSRKFLRLINEKNYDEALDIARKQVEDGALVIDVNMDDGLLDAKQEMVNFVNLISSDPDIATVPIMIDSSNWDVIEAALKCVQGKCIVNSISLKEGEDIFIQHAQVIKTFGASCVVMCFDEVGQATTYERRIEIAERAYRLLTETVGMNPLDIIFDPNILSIATGMLEHDNYAVDFIKATKWIRENLPGAHVSGGVSNLSFSFRGNNYIREAMHSVFLYHAVRNGMDFGIVNPSSKITYSDLPKQELQLIEDVVLNRRVGATEELMLLADEKKVETQKTKDIIATGAGTSNTDSWRKDSLDNRLEYALRKGVTTYLREDIAEALTIYTKAVDIIEGPLMRGMNTVGQLFGEGKMFLPQVVKTARTMKQAVDILQPYIENDKHEGGTSAGRVVIATVKGDVHDIGKNIVSVVMSCNNFEMIDLGVMVPPEQIVASAIDNNADIVCLSGLITPSLDEMVNVVKAMQKAGLTIPVIVGGATTSELHAALKIAPEYDGTVVWMKDAAQNVASAAKLLSKREATAYISSVNERYEMLRTEYKQKQDKLVSIEDARNNKLRLFN